MFNIRSAYWLMFISTLLWGVSEVQCTIIKDKRQAKFFGRDELDYAVVYPRKVTHEGHHLSYDLRHFVQQNFRHRRSANVGGESNLFVHYHLSVLGHDVILRLLPTSDVLGPGLVIEKKKKGHNSSILLFGNEDHCLFQGEIPGTNSQVALAACHGLQGLIRKGNDTFFIEPVLGHEPNINSSQPHVLYRSRTPVNTIHHDGQTCGSKVKKHWNKDKDKRQTRKRRSVSVERNVETLVVADKTMVEYYSEEDITTYILTIINMVSNLYHDSSIGNAINIVLVRVLLLENQEEEKKEGLEITQNADDTLKSFCRWQKFINPKGEKHPNHHDVAILLTRQNICTKTDQPCSTLGLAEVAGMCQPHRSCSVNEDTGLALAFTIAHEMGHNFGMSHDSQKNGCQMEGNVQHVMSPHLNSEVTPFSWSSCSRDAITKFLDHDWGSCLDDSPSEHKFSFPELPPGALYDTDHQCRLQYGVDAAFCRGMEDICQTLWCKQSNKCVTRLEPAAEGTLCGRNKWCKLGKCTVIGERQMSIDGEWSTWSTWSECSRTCGAGVRQSERRCDSPGPSFGGRYCIGERKRHTICNSEKCPENSKSFREVQCAKFNTIPYKDELHSWLPVVIPMTPCQLHCKPEGQFYSVMLSDTVEDGTECKPGTKDVCINGKCRRVSCDWGIDSTAKEDRCGVCHGDGTQCTLTKGIFDTKVGIGYVEVVVVPKGARNLVVEEVADATNYIAVQSLKGEFYLNGQWFIQWSGEYMAGGTKLYYQREVEKEKLYAPGPLKESLRIMLLYQTENPGVVYEYTVPLKNGTRVPKFHWKLEDWTACSSTCGGGEQVSKPACFELEESSVEDSHCNAAQRPQQKRRECNKHPCPAKWWTGPWQHCSVRCGGKGVRRRAVICVQFIAPSEQVVLSEKGCKSLNRPKDREPCQRKRPCPQQAWDLGHKAVDGCSEDTCKNGQDCDISDRKGKTMANELDLGERTNGSCAIWIAGNWSQCSVSCGEGTMSREVHCLPKGSKCNVGAKPQTFMPCSKKPCIDWVEGQWSQCSVTCGGGTQTRHVKCINLINQTISTGCALNRQPNQRRVCMEGPCPSRVSAYH